MNHTNKQVNFAKTRNHGILERLIGMAGLAIFPSIGKLSFPGSHSSIRRSSSSFTTFSFAPARSWRKYPACTSFLGISRMKNSQTAAQGAVKVVVITGITRGLGRALALELAARGHTVVGCGRNEEKLASLQTQLNGGSKHLLKTADVASDSSVEEFAKVVMETKGVPHIIVNNAGIINENGKLWEVPSAEFNAVIDVNIKGPANIMRHFLPRMISRKHGIVVNISSGWGRSVAAEVAPYCASKWAIEGLTKSVAKEVPPGVAVVALNPGVINTDMLASCFGASAAMYPNPESWAPHAADVILGLTAGDNGASLNV